MPKKLRGVLTKAPGSQSIRNPGWSSLHVFVTKLSEKFQSQYEGYDVPTRSVSGLVALISHCRIEFGIFEG
jgi:hypothetical protein